MIAKPSAEPTPRPPLTTTLASARETPPAAGRVELDDADGELGLGQLGDERLDPRAARGGLGGDDVRRDGEERRRAVDPGLLEKAPTPSLARDADGAPG